MSKRPSRARSTRDRSAVRERNARHNRTAPDPDEPRETLTGADDREGATENQVGDRTGPGAGYDKEPLQEDDDGGVMPS